MLALREAINTKKADPHKGGLRVVSFNVTNVGRVAGPGQRSYGFQVPR